MSSVILTGMPLLVNNQWLNDHALVIDAAKIAAIMPVAHIKSYQAANVYQFSAEHRLVPGFIDLHIHGANGADVMDASLEALQTISHTLAREGVTGFLATTMTASADSITDVMQRVARFKRSEQAAQGAAILGVHLEGPFIANNKLGAQLGDYALAPNIELVKQWQQQSDNLIKLITLAPELHGATDFIAQLVTSGIRVASGHTNATYAETQQAITAGCTHATHLFNAMRGLHHREPGAAGALLLSRAVTAELIADDVHLHPAILDLAWRVKGKEKLVLVTDAMRAKCLGHGTYDLGGQTVTVAGQMATLADGTLAGSVLTMPKAIQCFQQATGCALEEAIQLATLNPAKVLGIANQKGSLAVGKEADCVVLDGKGQVVMTVCAGRVVYQAPVGEVV